MFLIFHINKVSGHWETAKLRQKKKEKEKGGHSSQERSEIDSCGSRQKTGNNMKPSLKRIEYKEKVGNK